MITIWKYDIKIDDIQTINLNAKLIKILDIHLQYGEPKLWCLVDTELPKESIEILCIGTGHSLWDYEKRYNKNLISNMIYIGSFLLSNDNYVGHVFKIGV